MLVTELVVDIESTTYQIFLFNRFFRQVHLKSRRLIPDVKAIIHVSNLGEYDYWFDEHPDYLMVPDRRV
jgi:hypothetical protein